MSEAHPSADLQLSLLERIQMCRMGHAKGTQTEEILYEAYNEIERLHRSPRPLIVFQTCEKHKGMGWTMLVGYSPPPRAVCPICEPPHTFECQHEWVCFQSWSNTSGEHGSKRCARCYEYVQW